MYNPKHEWMATKNSARLHYAKLTPQRIRHMDKEGQITGQGPIKLLCGIRTSWVFVPGVLERMTTERCRRCCKMLKYPQGLGSPKNDPACRKILGLK